MSTLLTPPDQQAPRPPTRRRPAPWRAAAAGLRASLLGLLATAVLLGAGWATVGTVGAPGTPGTSGPAVTIWEAPLAAGRVLALVVLLAHGGDVELSGGPVGLVPLGLLAIPVAVLVRAGRTVAIEVRPATTSCIVRLVATLALAYAIPVTALSLLAGPGARGTGASPGALALGAVAGGWGLLRARSPWSEGRAARPRMSAVLAAGSVGALILLGAGAGLVGTGLIVHFWRGVELARSVAADPVAGGGLLLAQLALVPNAAIWGAGFAAGPGFALGSATVVAPTGIVLGPLPAVPVLAALPAPGPPPPAMLLVHLVPLAAGIAAGMLLLRRCRDSGPWTVGLLGAASGLVAGTVLGLLCLTAGGPLGDGRLRELGPPPAPVGTSAGVQVGAAAALTAGLARRRSARSAGKQDYGAPVSRAR